MRMKILKNVLFLPDSPVKIISADKLASEWASKVDYEGTSIKTKYAYIVFKWRFKEFCKTIQHPFHGLPEMIMNDTNSGIFPHFDIFVRLRRAVLGLIFALIPRGSILHCHFTFPTLLCNIHVMASLLLAKHGMLTMRMGLVLLF